MDSKQQEKVNVIKKRLSSCTSVFTCHTYGNIPSSKISNAIASYADGTRASEVIGLIDETVFGSGKRGFLFTFDGYYYDGCERIHLYKNSGGFRNLSSSYNLSAMNKMISELSEIDNRKGFFASAFEAFGGVDGILNSIGSSAEAVDLMDKAKSHTTYMESYSNALRRAKKKIDAIASNLDDMTEIQEYGAAFETIVDVITKFSDYIEDDSIERLECVDEFVDQNSDEYTSLATNARYAASSFAEIVENLPDPDDFDDLDELAEQIQSLIDDLMDMINELYDDFSEDFQIFSKVTRAIKSQLKKDHPYLLGD